jgi:Ni,Fe-hydrogenase III large subunit/Ni,Fe-hydrogenase III component G
MKQVVDINRIFEENNAIPKSKNGAVNYIAVPEENFITTMANISGKNVVLVGLFCVQNFDGHPGFSLLYVLEKRNYSNIVIVTRRLEQPLAGSVATLFPSACWFEREITDGFGVTFPDSFDKRHLFLHEVYPEGFHPLRKDFRNQPVITSEIIPVDNEYVFKKVTGEGVYQIPVGPVHAGIIEPGHFRFSVIGETIFNLEIRMFYKHRGIEKLAEGKTPQQAVQIAESISGDESAANAVAFCMAVENTGKIEIPKRAWQLRTILLEMERIYSHLGDMAGMITDVAFPKGASPFYVLREEILRMNNNLTGSRFMKGIICPGGLTKDIPSQAIIELSKYLEDFTARLKSATDSIYATSSVIDRLETTGVIKKELVNLLNITGPAARASGVPIDTRFDRSYGIYGDISAQFHKRIAEKGDVLDRFNVKAAEINDSAMLILNLIAGLVKGEICVGMEIRDGYALSLVEAPRGQNLHWVNIKDGRIDRYKVRTASFCNWQAIEHAVLGNIVPDFPLINKSLNLSYAGTDL